MKENFVSYNQAVRLKKLGFGGNGLKNYTPQGYYKFPNGYVSPIKHDGDGILVQFRKENAEKIPAPSLSQAQKWLREEHNLHIIVWPYNYSGSINNKYQFRMFEDVLNSDLSNPTCGFDNYEPALSAGLDAALKLLEENSSSN